jgi:hypothetical protein
MNADADELEAGRRRPQFYRLEGRRLIATTKAPAAEIVLESDTLESVTVRTVFTGTVSGWDREGKPLVFRTTVTGGRQAGNSRVYSSQDAAEEGHRKLMRELFPPCTR